MPAISETNNLGDLLKYEAPNLYSRDLATVAAGQNLQLGAIVGRDSTTGKLKALDPAATDGTEVAVGILHAALPASADVRNGVAFVRLAEVAAARLTGLDAAAIADLKTRHLIVR